MPFNFLDYPIMLRYPTRRSQHNPWVGHIPFAMMLMQMAQPRTLVELGTFEGTSYCAFCQAISELKLSTRCFGIDTWRGDEHQGPYSEHVFNDLSAFHNSRYGHFSTLVRKLFDEAVSDFADGSIDVLHIDGLHTYEAVKHDYETWKPKLSDRGIVLFHDTFQRKQDFGVWKLWEEVRHSAPSFAFTHYSGLGILAVGKNAPPAALEFLQEANARPDPFGMFFFVLGHYVDTIRMLNHVGDFINNGQQFLDDWKTRAGLPIQNAQINAHDFTLAAAQRLASAIADLAEGDPRRRG